MPIVLKYGSLNLLEPSGPVQASNGIALPLPLLCTHYMEYNFFFDYSLSKFGHIRDQINSDKFGVPTPVIFKTKAHVHILM